MQAVAERIASELPDVRLQTVVTKVRWGPDGAHVICQDGSVLVADVVIVTVSLGVLKAGISFNMSLFMLSWTEQGSNAS